MNKLYLLFLSIFLGMTACTRNNIREQQQWTGIFKQYALDSVCVELADNSHDQVYYYNLSRISRRFTPASTFKIVNSLIALETNIAPDENMVIQGVPNEQVREACQQDLSMRQAFTLSCVPYYQELARRIGSTEMKHWLDTLHYGNASIGRAVDSFWLNNDLLISADEQVGLMKKLYFDKLPFSQRSHRIVRSLMLREDSSAYRLYYKTGTALGEEKLLAWIVGFIERKEVQKGILTRKVETNYKPYFFALNFETKDTLNYSQKRLALLKDILRERQILPR